MYLTIFNHFNIKNIKNIHTFGAISDKFIILAEVFNGCKIYWIQRFI